MINPGRELTVVTDESAVKPEATLQQHENKNTLFLFSTEMHLFCYFRMFL